LEFVEHHPQHHDVAEEESSSKAEKENEENVILNDKSSDGCCCCCYDEHFERTVDCKDDDGGNGVGDANATWEQESPHETIDSRHRNGLPEEQERNRQQTLVLSTQLCVVW
jgi:hypothetical protein